MGFLLKTVSYLVLAIDELCWCTLRVSVSWYLSFVWIYYTRMIVAGFYRRQSFVSVVNELFSIYFILFVIIPAHIWPTIGLVFLRELSEDWELHTPFNRKLHRKPNNFAYA